MFILIVSSVFATLARASTLLECTNDAGHEIVLRYEGPAPDDAPSPGGWRMRFKGQEFSSTPAGRTPPPNIAAEATGPNQTLITITHAQTPSGPVGLHLLFDGLDGPTPTVTETIFGGFVGRATMPVYGCTKQENYCGDLLGG